MFKNNRSIPIILALFLILTLIVSCKPKNSNDTSSIASSNSSNIGGITSSSLISDTDTSSVGSDVASTVVSGESSEEPFVPLPIPNLNGATIRFNNYWYDEVNTPKSQMGKYRLARIAEIEKILNCKVEMGTVEPNTIFQKLIAGDDFCDIIDIMGPHMLPGYMKNNLLSPLNNLGINFKDPKFDAAVTKTLTFDGKHYGLIGNPEGIEKISLNYVMFFNQTLLKKLGINDDLYTIQKNGQWTWAKFEELCIKITRDTDGDNKPDIWGTTENSAVYGLLQELMASNNGDWIKRTSDNPITYKFTAASDPNAFEALQFWQKLACTDKVMDLGIAGETTTFIQGKVGFMPTYLNRTTLPGFIMGMKDDYGILFMPKGPKATDYVSQLQYYDAEAIVANALRDDDTNRTKAKGLAAFINLWCDPLLPVNQASTIEKLQKESIVRDKGSLDTINQIKQHQVMSENQIGWDVITGLGAFDDSSWYKGMEAIGQGQDPAAVIEQHINQYNAALLSDWQFAQ